MEQNVTALLSTASHLEIYFKAILMITNRIYEQIYKYTVKPNTSQCNSNPAECVLGILDMSGPNNSENNILFQFPFLNIRGLHGNVRGVPFSNSILASSQH